MDEVIVRYRPGPEDGNVLVHVYHERMLTQVLERLSNTHRQLAARRPLTA